ncbi:NUDIX hydrolase domain-like protein [Aspergillus fruticulosus]
MNPNEYTVAPQLQKFNIPFHNFRLKNPRYAHFVGGAIIFLTTAERDTVKILLLQRAKHVKFGTYWEFPGGKCEEKDPTYLHATAREILEETGLHVSKFVKLVNQCEWQKEDESYVAKFTFIVEVHELGPTAPASSEDLVTLDDKEHQKFAWATEGDVKASSDDENSGDENGTFRFFGNQREIVLKAFADLGKILSPGACYSGSYCDVSSGSAAP